ncbi:MAG: hypothetical protein JO165_03960 [Candidatus Eremiobacteraeota bacterium]|nr:hypothetical protein [Candidatus Eremiobacteraeota bacterium]
MLTIPPVTIPCWKSQFTYGGKNYTFAMVGSNPMTSPQTTQIANEIVPVRLTFSDGTTFDPTSSVAGMVRSPLYTSGAYSAGTTQYGDAFMRSQFWTYAANQNYHVLFSAPIVEPTVSLTVPAANGYVRTVSGSKTGYITFAWLESIEQQIIQQMNLPPTGLSIFATYNTKSLEPSGYCCYSGYHDEFSMTLGSQNAIATTAWASITPSSVETMSHEISEWLDDPFYVNYVPYWRNPQSNACNGDLLEVGDPVTNHVFTVNGWGMQDETFYSWFTRDTPSIGINGAYDLMGKLTTPSVPC